MTDGPAGTRAARRVLVVDGVGCLATSLVVAASPRLLRIVDKSTKSRPWIAGALVATGTVMTVGGLRSASPTTLRAAAVTNAGWVTVCVLAVPRQTGWGLRLVSVTALLDATMGVLQWQLASDGPLARRGLRRGDGLNPLSHGPADHRVLRASRPARAT